MIFILIFIIIRIIYSYKNFINMSKMKVIIRWEGDHPLWTLEIEVNKTILELKQSIASHYNSTNTGFNIIIGDEVIDSSKDNYTLKDCGIKRIIRLPYDYIP